MNRTTWILGAVVLCLGACSGKKVDAPTGVADIREVYIEYPGPNAKWAGPPNFWFMMELAGEGPLEITMSALTEDTRGEGKGQRTLASHSVPKEDAREIVGQLAEAMVGEGAHAEKKYTGCLYPVRARLVRTDGALIERTGCRGQKGWESLASQVVAEFVAATQSVPRVGVREVSVPVILRE